MKQCYKTSRALVLVLLILMQIGFVAVAQDKPVSDGSGVHITKILWPIQTLRITQSEVPEVMELLEYLWNTVPCDLEDGREIDQPVSWDMTQLSLAAVGTCIVPGRLLLSEADTLAPGLSPTIDLQFTIEEDPLTILPPTHVVLDRILNEGRHSRGILVALGQAEEFQSELARRQTHWNENLIAWNGQEEYLAPLRVTTADISSISFDTPGKYQLTIGLELGNTSEYPEGFFSLAQTIQQLTIAVWVTDPSIPELFLQEINDSYLDFCFYDTQWTQQSQLYYYMADTQLTEEELEKVQWQPVPDTILSGLTLYRGFFQQDVQYYFRSRYADQQSTIISVMITKDDVLCDSFEGDRDGGGNNTTLPDISQPVPEKDGPTELPEEKNEVSPQKPDGYRPSLGKDFPNVNVIAPSQPPIVAVPQHTVIPNFPTLLDINVQPNPQTPSDINVQPNPQTSSDIDAQPNPQTPSDIDAQPNLQTSSDIDAQPNPQTSSATNPLPQLEQETQDGIHVSGLRVHALIQQQESLVLTKHKMTLRMDWQSLAELNLQDQDLLTLELEQPTEDQIKFRAMVNATELSSLPTVWLRVPYDSKTAGTPCDILDADGILVAQCSPEGGYLAFEVTAPGEYTIVETVSSSQPVAMPAAPLSLVTVVVSMAAIALLAGLTWLLKRQRQ